MGRTPEGEQRVFFEARIVNDRAIGFQRGSVSTLFVVKGQDRRVPAVVFLRLVQGAFQVGLGIDQDIINEQLRDAVCDLHRCGNAFLAGLPMRVVVEGRGRHRARIFARRKSRS